MDRVHVGSTAQEMHSGTHFDCRSVFSWIESDLDHPLQKEIKRKIDWGKRTLSLCCHEAVAFKLRFLHSRNELFLPVLRAEIMRFLLSHNFFSKIFDIPLFHPPKPGIILVFPLENF